MVFIDRKARRGIVISATIRMEDTALNLAYIGTYLKKKRVSGMKLCPHARNIDNRVATNNAHLYGPFTISNPNRKRKQIIAPTYTGPDVKGCVPQ